MGRGRGPRLSLCKSQIPTIFGVGVEVIKWLSMPVREYLRLGSPELDYTTQDADGYIKSTHICAGFDLRTYFPLDKGAYDLPGPLLEEWCKGWMGSDYVNNHLSSHHWLVERSCDSYA